MPSKKGNTIDGSAADQLLDIELVGPIKVKVLSTANTPRIKKIGTVRSGQVSLVVLRLIYWVLITLAGLLLVSFFIFLVLGAKFVLRQESYTDYDIPIQKIMLSYSVPEYALLREQNSMEVELFNGTNRNIQATISPVFNPDYAVMLVGNNASDLIEIPPRTSVTREFKFVLTDRTQLDSVAYSFGIAVGSSIGVSPNRKIEIAPIPFLRTVCIYIVTGSPFIGFLLGLFAIEFGKLADQSS
jgi:hypothetical protein